MAYLRIVSLYRSGLRQAAIDRLRSWRLEDTDRALTKIVRVGPTILDWPAASTRGAQAASLMHASVAVEAAVDGHADEHDRHVMWALSLFGRLYRTGSPDRLLLEPKEFYLAWGATELAVAKPATARMLALQGLELQPKSPELLLLAGEAEEVIADVNRQYQRTGGERPALRRAERYYRKVKGAEARLRLGRVLEAQARFAEAEDALSQALAEAADPRQRYLASLLLGRVRQRTGRLDAAATAYRDCLAQHPDSAAARIALANVLERSSGPEAARVLLRESLDLASRPGRALDPWWSYQAGHLGLQALEQLETRLRLR